MSVRRYRDVGEMPPPERGDPADPNTWVRVKNLWRRSSRGLPPLFPRGVFRFASIDESKRARDEAVIARMRAVRASRQK